MLGDISPRLGAEAVTARMDRCGAKTLEELLRLCAIRYQSAAFQVRMALFHQPFGRVPRAVRALAGNALDAAARADILHAKRDELR